MKKIVASMLTAALALSLTACSGAASDAETSSEPSQSAAESLENNKSFDQNEEITSIENTVRVAGLKGPTTMGLVNLDNVATQDYDLAMYGSADEVVPLLVGGEVDVAAIPANLAATLYQKTDGGIEVVAINTRGVLYVVEQGNTVQSVQDLKGRTVLSTGKGTTPEYVLRHILIENDIDPDNDVTIEYFSEATEVSARMAEATDAIAVLPQPYVTSASAQNENLQVALDLTAEWDKIESTSLVTGVTVVRKEFAEENPDAVETFLLDYSQSAEMAVNDLEGTAVLCEEYGVVAKAAVAQKALPLCNIVCVTGDEMRTAVSNYLQVLYDADAASVGGQLPDEDFYYLNNESADEAA